MRVNNWNKPRKWGCNYCKTVHRTTFYFPLRQADKLAPARRATRPICSRMRFTKTGRSENHKNHHRDIKTVPFNKVPLLPTLNEGVIYRSMYVICLIIFSCLIFLSFQTAPQWNCGIFGHTASRSETLRRNAVPESSLAKFEAGSVHL